MFIFILASASQPRSLSPLKFYTMWDGTSNSTFNHIQSSYSNYIFTDFTALSQILGILSQVPTESRKRLGQVRTWSSLGLLWGEQSLDAFSRWGSRGPNLLALEGGTRIVPGQFACSEAHRSCYTAGRNRNGKWRCFLTNMRDQQESSAVSRISASLHAGFERLHPRSMHLSQHSELNILKQRFFLHPWHPLASIYFTPHTWLDDFFLLRPHFNLAWMAKRPPF